VAGAHPVVLELGTRKPECATVKVAEQGTMGLVTLDDTESPSSGFPKAQFPVGLHMGFRERPLSAAPRIRATRSALYGDASYLAHASKALSRGCLLLNVRYGSSDGHKQPVRLR
jgi:hypothetical protein